MFQTKGESGRTMVIKDRSRKRRREAGMRIRKEAIWPTECPVRTGYKGFLYLFYSGFRLFHSSILRDSFPIRSRLSNPLDVFRLRSSLDCESYVLESVGYVTRRKRKLDFLGRNLVCRLVSMIRAIPVTNSTETRFQGRGEILLSS